MLGCWALVYYPFLNFDHSKGCHTEVITGFRQIVNILLNIIVVLLGNVHFKGKTVTLIIVILLSM